MQYKLTYFINYFLYTHFHIFIVWFHDFFHVDAFKTSLLKGRKHISFPQKNIFNVWFSGHVQDIPSFKNYKITVMITKKLCERALKTLLSTVMEISLAACKFLICLSRRLLESCN